MHGTLGVQAPGYSGPALVVDGDSAAMRVSDTGDESRVSAWFDRRRDVNQSCRCHRVGCRERGCGNPECWVRTTKENNRFTLCFYRAARPFVNPSGEGVKARALSEPVSGDA